MMCSMSVGMHCIHMFLAEKASTSGAALFSAFFTYILCPSESLVPIDLVGVAGSSTSIPLLKLLFDAVDTGAFGVGFNLHSLVVGFKAERPLVVEVFGAGGFTFTDLNDWHCIFCWS